MILAEEYSDMIHNALKHLSLALTLGLTLNGVLVAQTPAEPDQALQARLAAYVEARLAGDWASAYRLELRSRSPEDPADPMVYYQEQSKQQRLSKAQVDGVTLEGDRATAKLSGVEILVLGSHSFRVPRFFESRWQRAGGDWYQVEWRQYVPEAILKLQAEQEAAALAAQEARCREFPEECAPLPRESAAPPVEPTLGAPAKTAAPAAAPEPAVGEGPR